MPKVPSENYERIVAGVVGIRGGEAATSGGRSRLRSRDQGNRIFQIGVPRSRSFDVAVKENGR